MSIIKWLFLPMFTVLLALPIKAQGLATTIKTQAMDMANALMENDFNSFVKYMHPAIIQFAGGKEQMKIRMDSAYGAMKRYKVSFKRYHIGNPGEIVTYKNSFQALLPQSTTLLTPMGELTAETYMIVISPDKGKSWWFIDTNVYQGDKLKAILPDLSPQLVIPPREKPKLTPIQNGGKSG